MNASPDPAAPLAHDEAGRLALLAECGILDTTTDPDFDDLSRLAAEICGTPIALISLVDETRQWFKSRVGLDATETPRHLAFCAHAIVDSTQLMIVPDAAVDPRFSANELVTGPVGIRFYAGAPLVMEGGHALGTLCVIDRQPRDMTAGQREALAALARQVVSQIQLRRQNLALERARIEQKQMAETLRQQKSELRVLFDCIPALVVFKDTQDRLVRVNQRLADSVGKTVAEIEGKLTAEIFPHDAARFHAEDLEVIRSGVPKLEIVGTFRDRDGRDVWIQTDKVPVRDPEGKVIGLIGMAQDITKRKESEAALEDLARRLQLATKASGTGVWDWDLETDRVVWDEQMFALYGLDPTEVTYETWARAVHPEDLDGQAAILDETVRRRWRSERQFRIRRGSDGAERIIYAAEMTVTGNDGEAVRVVGVNRDVTDLETAAASLAASDELLRRLIQHTPAAIAMLDREMCYLQVSDRWIKDYHLEGRDLIGLSHYEVFPDIPDRWKSVHQRVLAGAVERCDEGPFPGADGRTEWLQWEARPWFNASREIGGLVFFTQIITGQREAKEFLKASLAEKETLLKEVHHRVKNNLQVISSLLQLQSEGLVEPRLLTLFREAQDRVRAMAQVHESLHRSGNLAAVNFGAQVVELAGNLLRSYRTDGAPVRLETETQPVQIDIDLAVPLSLIVNELVTNTFKYAFSNGRGGVLRVIFRECADGALFLSIGDDRPGLPATCELEYSTSLGLKVVRTLAGQIGGRLEILRGHGTVFTLTFPRSRKLPHSP